MWPTEKRCEITHGLELVAALKSAGVALTGGGILIADVVLAPDTDGAGEGGEDEDEDDGGEGGEHGGLSS